MYTYQELFKIFFCKIVFSSCSFNL